MKTLQICDCTLRDGGYYTNWDFNENLAKSYFNTMNALPVITHIEIGYRSKPMNDYFGEYFYCPDHVMVMARQLCPDKGIAVLLNEKDTLPEDLNEVIGPCKSYIDLIRVAVDPNNLQRAAVLAKAIKKMGFQVAFNLMYMSKWATDKNIIEQLKQVENDVDYIYMVDSFGGVYPEDVKNAVDFIKQQVNIPIGFHGHDNMQMGLANTITAIDSGCAMIDATVTGMGRGAGNLKMELLLTYLNSKNGSHVDFNKLNPIVTEFEKMQKEYGWGSSLPYMISGAYSLPQKEVMSWISKRRYTTESIINALQNKKNNQNDNHKVPVLKDEESCKKVIIIGGGPNAKAHAHALTKFCLKNPDIVLIHAGTRFVEEFNLINNRQYFCLLGAEGYKLEKSLPALNLRNVKCILEPSPRKMGTILPEKIINKTFELSHISFIENYPDSLLSIAFQLSIELKSENVYLFGFDGYDIKNHEQMIEVSKENQILINAFLQTSINICSTLPTNYQNLKTTSIYSML